MVSFVGIGLVFVEIVWGIFLEENVGFDGIDLVLVEIIWGFGVGFLFDGIILNFLFRIQKLRLYIFG